MIRSRVRYFASELVRNVRRQPMLFAATLTTVATSALIVGLVGLIGLTAQDLTGALAQEIHATIYLRPDISEEALQTLLTRLRARPELRAVKALTADEDRARNRRLLPPELRQALPVELVPGEPCLDLVLTPAARTEAGVAAIARLMDSVEGTRGVESVLSGGEKVRLVFAVVEMVRFGGSILAVLLVLSAILFIFLNIRLAIHARQAEIATRQLMGATRTFVRIPFYLEGLVEGLLGAGLGAVALHLLVGSLNDHLRFAALLRYEIAPPTTNMLLLFVAAGGLLGLLASVAALGRYLRVLP